MSQSVIERLASLVSSLSSVAAPQPVAPVADAADAATIADEITGFANTMPDDESPIETLISITSQMSESGRPMPIGIIRSVLSDNGLPRDKHFTKAGDLSTDERAIVVASTPVIISCAAGARDPPVPFFDSLFRECILAKNDCVRATNDGLQASEVERFNKFFRLAVSEWYLHTTGQAGDDMFPEFLTRTGIAQSLNLPQGITLPEPLPLPLPEA